MNYNLEGLSKDEGKTYISEKLIGDTNKANFITTDIVVQAINHCELG